MKFSEMNVHQQIATRYARESCGWVIGGYENAIQDLDPESEDYKSAKASLADHEGLIDEIYDHVMRFTDKGMLKHIRFAGKDFIRERIHNRITKWGY